MRRSFPTVLLIRLAGLLALVIVALAILWQARRPDPSAGQERSDRLAGALDVNHALEQTFTAGRDDLCAVDVFPRIPPGRLNPRYTLTFHLRENGSTQDLVISHARLVDARSQQRATVTFPPQADSQGKTYVLRVETDAPADTVSLLSSTEDVYPGGELRQDGQPAGRDLTFRTYTALVPLSLIQELAQSAPEYGWMVLFSLILAAVGWAFFTLTHACPDADFFERGLWSTGAGLALIPLVFLLVGIRAKWVFVGLVALALVRQGLHWAKHRKKLSLHASRICSLPPGWPLALLYLWALAIRLLQVRDIPAPMWVDGLSHVQMVDAILDAGRMPGGLLYHIGFHTLVALLENLTRFPLPRLIVLFGQMISALTGPALYVLVKRVVFTTKPGSPARATTAGLLGAMALAIFPSLPAYLINWGRYPFLLGLTLLPFTLAATIDALRDAPARASLPRYALFAVLLAGQTLSHYGTFSFWLSFTAVFLLVERPTWIRQVKSRQVIIASLILLVVGLAAAYLRFGDNLVDKIAGTIAESRQVSDELGYASIWQINLRAGGLWLVLTGCAGVLWAVFYARRLLFLTAGWFAAQTILIAVQAPVFGFALASYANLLLALPLPLAALAGGLLAVLFEKPAAPQPEARQERRIANPAVGDGTWRAVAVLVLLAGSGGLSQIGILNPNTLMYGPADEQAMRWVQGNLPAGSKLLINSRRWGTDQIIPADGGGWIPTFTGRRTAYIQDKNQLTQFDAFVESEKIGYVYLGRFSGFLNRTMFDRDPNRYQRVYHADGVDIYSIHVP
jgi:hypothetical protein